MGSNEPIYPSPRINSHSIASLALGILTLLAFCGGMMPVPFSGFVCLPVSFLFGFLSLIYGTISLNTIRKNGETGKPMAWAGILMGGLVFLCMICAIIAILMLFFFAPDTVQPIIEGYSV
ncbi:MAG: DUF4190 domain-containing protein [Anaerolineales bacterium]|nr:DUF4190 domain-containing protein [Anaerolineales bacterium]